MNTTISHEALLAYLNFFSEDESWPENDPYSAYQPNFDHIIARLIVETYFNPKLGEVTDKGVNYLAQVLPEIDGLYGISLSTLPGKSIKGNSVKSVESSEIKQIIEVAKAIDFLMNMEAYDMAHYPDDDERSEDHSHEWALANLIDDECEDSLSFIGYEAYCLCRLATAVTIEAINPRPEDILGIISIAPRVLEVLEINQRLIPEIELFRHANRCLEFFANHKQDNCFPEGYVGARYLFKFPNSLVLSYVAKNEVYLFSSDNSLELNLPKEQWDFKKDTGAWLSKESFTPDYLNEVVLGFTQNLGKATLIFPWTEWIDRYGPLSEEWANLREELDPDEDIEELTTFTNSQESQKVVEKMSASNPMNFIFNVDHLFETGDALIPIDSQYSRYRRYCKELENLGWVIIDYMTDQGFAYDRLEEERKESNFDGVAPALVSPLESIFQAYTPSGSLDNWFAIIDIGDGNIEDLHCAEKFGLRIEIRDQELLTILSES